MEKIFNIDGHTIEFRSGSGSLNPWSSEYSREIGLSLVCTSDCVDYVMIDGEKIYRLRSFTKKMQLVDDLLNDVIASWDELMFFHKDAFEDFVGNFSEIKKELDQAKKENDEFKKLSPEEKKEYLARKRAERKAEIEREKREKQQ